MKDAAFSPNFGSRSLIEVEVGNRAHHATPDGISREGLTPVIRYLAEMLDIQGKSFPED
jgi:hypothetical protein